MSTSAFFTSDDAITRKLICGTVSTPIEDIDKVYEIKNSSQWILENGFLSVALQFPDNLLTDSPRVSKLIKNHVPNCTVFILGDTSYGSCCVDEVGAQHYKADCIIHYGPACLSPTTRLPVFYVLGRSVLDVDDCLNKICQQCSDTDMKIVLAYDTTYAYVIGQVFQQLQKRIPNLILSKMCFPHCFSSSQDSIVRQIYPECIYAQNENSTQSLAVIRCGRVISLPEDDDIDSYSFVYVGNPSGPAITNMMMNYNKCPFFAFDPQTAICQPVTLNVNRALMRRYYLIERAKDANIVGILIGTLGVAKYLDILDHLKNLLKKVGKKTYIFVVGKLNPQKLANFAEVDIYVLVSCPESCLLDQSDFHCPVVTPFEMEIACNKAREWTGDYTTDFSSLLPGSSMHLEAPETNEEEADVSLISNRIRVMGERQLPEVSSSTSQEVVVRSGGVVSTAENAGEFLSTRSWQGLEQNLGQTPVVKAVDGQAGIAASYSNEHTL